MENKLTEEQIRKWQPIECYVEYIAASNKSNGPRKLKGPETRIDKINRMLKTTKLTDEKRGLLISVKKTILSRRIH